MASYKNKKKPAKKKQSIMAVIYNFEAEDAKRFKESSKTLAKQLGLDKEDVQKANGFGVVKKASIKRKEK